MIAARAFAGIAVLHFFVPPTIARAEAFILKDGSCVVGEVYLRTSTNLFVRLPNGKSRNILLDLLDRRIEGAAAECPELLSPSFGSRTEPSARPSKEEVDPAGIQENEHEPRENSEQGKLELPPTTNPTPSSRSRNASISFLGAQVKLHEARLTERCLAVRVVPDEHLTSLQVQGGYLSQRPGSIDEFVDALDELRIRVVEDSTAPLLKIDYDSQSTFRLTQPSGSERRLGDGVELAGYESLLAAQLQMPTGEIVAEFMANWTDALDHVWREAWVLFLAASLQVQTEGIPMPTFDRAMDWSLKYGRKRDIIDVVKFFESSTYTPDAPMFPILHALATKGVESIDRIRTEDLAHLSAIVEQDPAKLHLIELLCDIKTEQGTASLVKLFEAYLERAIAGQKIAKPDKNLRKWISDRKEARSMVLEALAMRRGPDVLAAVEQGATTDPDSKLRTRAEVIQDSLKSRN